MIMVTDLGNLINATRMTEGVHWNTGSNPIAGRFVVTGIFSYTRMDLQKTFSLVSVLCFDKIEILLTLFLKYGNINNRVENRSFFQ